MFMLVINSVCEGSRLALLFIYLFFLHDGVNITGVSLFLCLLRKQLEQFLENVFGFFFVLLSYVNIGLIKKNKNNNNSRQFYLFLKSQRCVL